MNPRLRNFFDSIAASIVAAILVGVFMFFITKYNEIPYDIWIAISFGIFTLILFTIWKIWLRQFKIAIPLFDEKEKREIIIQLNSLIQDANSFLEKYKKGIGVIINNEMDISFKQMYLANVIVWRKTKVKLFIEFHFGREFYNQLKFEDKSLEPKAIRNQIAILESIVDELKND